MNPCTCSDTAQRPRRANTFFALLTIAFAAGPAGAAVASVVPAEYQGTWVPVQAACSSPLRVLITGDRLTLANGKDSQGFGGIEMAGPAYFPPDYRGIMAVLFTEFDGHQPVIAHFNVGEKKGAAQLELAAATAGSQTPQLKAYNAHISKLNLGRRFPLDKGALKKCAAG